MNVLGMLTAKNNTFSRSWAKFNFFVFLILAFGPSVSSTEIPKTTPVVDENDIVLPPPATSASDRVDSETNPATQSAPLQLNQDVDEQTNVDNPSLFEQLSPAEADTTDNSPIKPSLPVLPTSLPFNTASPNPVERPALPEDTPNVIQIRFRGLKAYKANSRSLPKSRPDISKTRVILDQELSRMKPPDAMFVPHIFDSKGRLLMRTLKNISPSTRKESQFYDAFSAARRQRRIPGQNHTAWNQNIRLRTRPKGKPANGFVFISSVFGTRPNPFGRGTEFHNGVDLVGAKGIPILATAAGKVVARSRGRGYGIHVLLDHGSGYKTLYAHLSRKRVKPNQKVKRGQIIGYLGSTGRSTGPHLHYSVYHNRQAVDPKPYMYK